MPSPTEILSQMRRPEGWDGWVPTYSGAGYRPWSANPGPLSLQDLAYGLSRTLRYGGHSHPGVTVAEHCVLAARILTILWPRYGLPLERAALLHDAAESVLHDLQAPIRRHVRVILPDGSIITWNESDTLVTRNIAKFFAVSPAHLDAPEVKAADILACCFEKRDCPNLAEGDWGLPPIPGEIAHLGIHGYSMPVAEKHFLEMAAVLGMG